MKSCKVISNHVKSCEVMSNHVNFYKHNFQIHAARRLTLQHCGVAEPNHAKSCQAILCYSISIQFNSSKVTWSHVKSCRIMSIFYKHNLRIHAARRLTLQHCAVAEPNHVKSCQVILCYSIKINSIQVKSCCAVSCHVRPVTTWYIICQSTITSYNHLLIHITFSRKYK